MVLGSFWGMMVLGSFCGIMVLGSVQGMMVLRSVQLVEAGWRVTRNQLDMQAVLGFSVAN